MKITTAAPTYQKEISHNAFQNGSHTDTLQSASTDRLFFQGEILKTDQLSIANFETKDYVDWNWIETRMSGSVNMDNGDSLIRQVDTLVSTYVGTKNHLEQTYAEDNDKLSENLAKLDAMFMQAKQRITSSYQHTVGNYYEELGNSKFRQEAGKSLSSAIDRRVEEMDKSDRKSTRLNSSH